MRMYASPDDLIDNQQQAELLPLVGFVSDADGL
jgi:hypothetical protein